MIQPKKALVGVRKPATEDALLYVPSTNGNLRLSQPAAELMGIPFTAVNSEEGFRIAVNEYSGADLGLATDDSVFLISFPDGESEGSSKLRSASGMNGGSLDFSGQMMYDALGGDGKNKQVWEVVAAHDPETGEEVPLSEVENPIAMLWRLSFKETITGVQRNYNRSENGNTNNATKGKGKGKKVPATEVDESLIN